MARRTAVGIDIGSHQVRVLFAEASGDAAMLPRVAGIGTAESRGVRQGYVVDHGEVVRSVRSALSQAERAAGIKIKSAFLGVGGIGLAGTNGSGTTVISRADSEITELDVRKAVDASQGEMNAALLLNRRIIHTVPVQYKIDGKVVYGRPVGMKGTKLEARVFFVTVLEQHLSDLVAAVEEAGVDVEEVVASPIAASLITLTKQQKIAGCVLANIGSETVSIVVFENDVPISLEVFPIGGSTITNDIALGLRIPLEEAEEVKRGGIVGTTYPRKRLEEIVEARLSDIFDLIEAHLKKLGRSGLLPAGIVITGGGSGIETIEDLARAALRLPARVASLRFGENPKSHVKDAMWAVAFGLCLLNLGNGKSEVGGTTALLLRRTRRDLLNWLKQFLP
ncbi:MAG: Cell division protein ftsA [Parcubacteria group bacterium Gr01-1014_72]|nr:MAG: Cell division protein ftsA [Parcubacteria group bacterium Gr01-1014_72]